MSKKSLLECLDECEKQINCYYMEQKVNPNECHLFDRQAYFHSVPLDATNKSKAVYLYMRLSYMKKELPGYRITSDHLRKATNVTDQNACWIECLKEMTCESISYNLNEYDCFLFKKGIQYFVENNDKFVSVSTEEIDLLTNIDLKRYKSTKLINHFKSISIVKEELCWKECSKTEQCVAISYKSNWCYLYKDYRVVRQNGWITIAFENEQLDSKYSLYYSRTQIHGQFLILNSTSENICWNECCSTNDCVAVSFSGDSNQCELITKSDYRRVERQIGWVSISLEDFELDKEYSNRYEKTLIDSDDFRSINAESEYECWTECVSSNECFAVSYETGGNCRLINKGAGYRVERKTSCVSISLEDYELDTEYSKIYDKSQISGFYIRINSTSVNSCWRECLKKRTECIAMSFDGENRCHLTKKGEYQVRRYNKWVSIYLENESPLKVSDNVNFTQCRFNIFYFYYLLIFY